MGTHGNSNRDTDLYPPHNSQFIWQQHTCGALGGSPMESGVVGQHYETPYFHPQHRHPPSRTLPLLLVQLGYGLLCALWVWRRRTNRRPCCSPMSNPSISSWTARPDGPGRWDNRMAAQHLPRHLVRPSKIRTRSNAEEKGVAYYALVDFHVPTDTSVHNWILVFWFLLMCPSALNWFLTYTLVVPLTLNLPTTSQFGCYWKYHTVVAITISI